MSSNSIDWCQLAVTLNRNPHHTFHKPTGESNPYWLFGYVPHKIFNHTQGKVSVSMDSDPINTNKQVNNRQL